MKNHWKESISITFISALLLHLALITGYIEKTSGAEGFFGHLIVLSRMMFLYPLVIFGSSFLVAILVKEERIRYFFIALVLALVINLMMFAGAGFYYQAKNSEMVSNMYIENPMSRSILDAERPLSIIYPSTDGVGVISPIEIVVYALPGVLENGKNVVEIRSHNFDSIDTVLWGSGILNTNNEMAPDGKRIVYKATVDYNPSENWERGQIIIRGNGDELEIRDIRP